MIPIISLPAKIIRLLESNVSPEEIAAGVCLGMFMGFIPLNGPMVFLLVALFLIIKLNRLSVVITLPVFKLLYVLGVSSVTDMMGGYLLIDVRQLTYLWRWVTGLPVIAYLDLNNTLVAGGAALSVILCVPVFMASRAAAGAMKKKYAEKIKGMKFVRWIKRLPFVDKAGKVIRRIRGEE
ncbi:MAG: TIGR03546 family protein [Candidatus Omnitrophota bacterium]